MKMASPEVIYIKNMRYTNRGHLYMSVLHTASFKEFGSLICFWQALKLWKMQLEVRSLNVTWWRDLWGHRVIAFLEMCQMFGWTQLWQIWRRYAPPFFAICEKPGGGAVTAPRPCAGWRDKPTLTLGLSWGSQVHRNISQYQWKQSWQVSKIMSLYSLTRARRISTPPQVFRR